jgi:integrase
MWVKARSVQGAVPSGPLLRGRGSLGALDPLFFVPSAPHPLTLDKRRRSRRGLELGHQRTHWRSTHPWGPRLASLHSLRQRRSGRGLSRLGRGSRSNVRVPAWGTHFWPDFMNSWAGLGGYPACPRNDLNRPLVEAIWHEGLESGLTRNRSTVRAGLGLERCNNSATRAPNSCHPDLTRQLTCLVRGLSGLVRHLAKVEVAGSNPVIRSLRTGPRGRSLAFLTLRGLSLQQTLQQESLRGGRTVASIQTYRRPRGTTYRVMWRTPDGAQRSRSFKTRPEARDWRGIVDRLEAVGQAPDPSRGDVPLDVWAEQVIGTLHLKPKTVEAYASLLRSRILPKFSGQPIGTISRQQVREWVSDMAGEVSPKRTRNAHGLLSRLLNEAVLDGRLVANPAAGVPLPRVIASEVEPWTAEELMAVAGAAGRYEPLIVWLGLMGTRWAETVGLEWDKIRGGVAVIDSTLSEVNGKFHRVPTKTFTSRRLPLPEQVSQRLPERRQGLVFTTTQGNPVRSAAFRSRIFLPACERAGVRPIRIHDLRHTCASLLMGHGASPKTVQAWLGHNDIRVTMNTYTHAYSTDLEDAARCLGDG